MPVKIRLVVTGRGYHAAESLPDQWEVPDQATVDDVIRMLAELYGDGPGWSATMPDCGCRTPPGDGSQPRAGRIA